MKQLSGLREQKLDEKGRWIVPTDLRVAIGVHFWLTIDQDSNMVVIPNERWEVLNGKWEALLEDSSLDSHDIDAIDRTLTYAVEIEATRDWRIPVPELIRRKAGFQKDVVTVGSLDRLVVWDRERFFQTEEEKFDHPETRKRQRLILRGVSPLNGSQEGEINGDAASSRSGDGE